MILVACFMAGLALPQPAHQSVGLCCCGVDDYPLPWPCSPLASVNIWICVVVISFDMI